MKLLLALGAVLLALPSMVIAVVCPLPDTGQTRYYNNYNEIICPNPGEAFYGQDAQYAPRTPHSYTKLDATGNELPDEATAWMMVRDNITGMIWEVKQNRDDVLDYANPHDADNLYAWSGSLGDGTGLEEDIEDFINAINTEQFCGHSDWRLPTIKELFRLVDSSIGEPGPTINTVYFPNTVSAGYWSSTADTWGSEYAFCINFRRTSVLSLSMSVGHYVRAVRGGQCASFGNYIDNDDGTITDTDTGLMWQKDTPNSASWGSALGYCEYMKLAGYNDWRLPNRNELQSIVDYSRHYPSIDPVFNAVSSWYWSSTTIASYPRSAWGILFTEGSSYNNNIKTYSLYVRAVRGGQCGSPGDSDGDTVCDDGDNNGILGDNPCLGGEKLNCDDNCPSVPNSKQEDGDGDSVGDVCDNCPNTPNGQALGTCYSWSGMADGTTCSNDTECGGLTSSCSVHQEDTDIDNAGDVCDNCPNDYNFDQADLDADGVGNACDNCPDDYNPLQNDCDNDGAGDICDPDTIDPDGDGIDIACDNCPNTPNPNQEDTDSSGIGNACNDLIDADSDEWEDSLDNCPSISNTLQEDSRPPQGNDIGDACDCEGDFTCDGDVDGSDASTFKADFGRSVMVHPCVTGNTCNGDYSCDGDVDGTDASLFKADFGRSSMQNPCPVCVVGQWCSYPLP